MSDEFNFAPSRVLQATFPRSHSFGDIAKASVSSKSTFLARGGSIAGSQRGSVVESKKGTNSDEGVLVPASATSIKHLQPRPWSEIDFSGKYHKYQIKSKYPIPGTAVGKDVELRNQGQEQRESLRKALAFIQDKHATILRKRCRRQDLDTKISFEIGVEDIIRRADIALQAKEKRIKEIGASIHVRHQPPEVRKTFEEFMFYVRKNNYTKIELILHEGLFKYLNLKDGPFGDTPIIYACNRGFAQLGRVLLQGGADPNLCNDIGHYPIHRIWSSWKGKCLVQQRRDRASTLSLLRDLLAFGADPNVIQQNGWTALHEAARRGPVDAVHTLLLFKADETAVDVYNRIPMMIAAESQDKGARERRELLRAWYVVRKEMNNFEFKQGWWQFCHDRHARLGKTKPIDVFLASLNGQLQDDKNKKKKPAAADDEEVRPMVDRYGNKAFAIVDEVMTGPIDIPDMRDQTPKLVKKGKTGVGASTGSIKKVGPPRYPGVERLSVPLDKYLLGQEEPNFISKLNKKENRQDDGEEKGVTKYELRYLKPPFCTSITSAVGVKKEEEQQQQEQQQEEQGQNNSHASFSTMSEIQKRRKAVATAVTSCASLGPKVVVRDALDSVIHSAIVREEVKEEGGNRLVIVRPQRRGLDAHGRPKTGAYLGLRLIPRSCPTEQQQLEEILLQQGGGWAADIRKKRREAEERARALLRQQYVEEKDIPYKDKLFFNDEAILPAGGVTHLAPLPGSDEPTVRGAYLQSLERKANPRAIPRYLDYEDPWANVKLFHKILWN